MAILPIDPALLDLHAVDEDESEAVALGLLELIFAETNALYRQHCLARDAVETTAQHLTCSLFDALSCSQLTPEDPVDSSRFLPDPSPVPEINDRHAARCLPHRSPEKPDAAALDRIATSQSPTQRSRAESYRPDGFRMSIVRRRKKPDKGLLGSNSKTNLTTIPQVITVPEEEVIEDPDKEVWRQSCLKELTGDGIKTINTGPGTKFTGFTQQSPLVEPKVSCEVEVMDNAPLLLRQEVAGSKAVTMKSSLNSFCAISTGRDRRDSVRSRGTLAAGSSKRNSLSASQSAPTLPNATARKASTRQLHDTLSRKRSTMVPTSDTASLSVCNSSTSAEVHPWQFESPLAAEEEGVKRGFAPDLVVASAVSIPTTIALTAGVGLTFGESTVKGPELKESSHTMSRKRFELHQRLATEMLLQESLLLQQACSPSPPRGSAGSPHGSVSPLSTYSHHHHKNSPRPYETVPADPIPMPALSPITKDALIIPRNHLNHAATTPTLRVRNPSARRRNEAPSLVSTEEIEAMRRSRPSTATLGAVVTSKTVARGIGDTGRLHHGKLSASASAKYLREFPKPHAGTIRLNSAKPLLALDTTGSDSARQRLAWIS